jgi:hypothetical protein
VKPTAALLAQLEPLPYPDRMAALARWARGSADVPRVVAELATGSRYERFLAVTATVISGGDVTPFSADRDGTIRAVALKHELRTGRLAGADLVTRIADAPATARALVYRTLRTARLTVAADDLIDAVLDRYGDHEAARLLPACGPDTARRLLPLLDHAVNLSVLARRHPEVLLDHAEARLGAATGEERARLWTSLGPAMLETGRLRVVDLLERYAPAASLPGPLRAYGRLATRAPARIVALLSTPARASWLRRVILPAGLLRRLSVLGDDDLLPLARRLRNSPSLLVRLPPARRGAIYDASHSDVEAAARVQYEEVLEPLPRAIRAREAERVLKLDAIRDNPALTLWWTAFLPWDQARPVLEEALRSGAAGTRADGYALLLDAARRSRDPQAVASAVETLLRLRNEPEPVRSRALDALADLPPQVTAGSAETLKRIAANLVEARDVTGGELGVLRGFAVGVLRHHVGDTALRDFALHTFELLSRNGDVPPLGRFDRTLRRGQEVMVFEQLRAWIENGMRRGRYEPLFAVTRALGKRARRLPDLQAMLHRAIGRSELSWVVRAAVERWLDDPATRTVRVAQVLAADSSTVTIPVVWATISARRTDLLDPVLTGRGPAGRFIDKGVRWVPGGPRHADRWLPRQLEAFVRLQALVADDTGAELRIRASALADAARAGGRELLLRYVGSSEVVLAEAALGALPYAGQDALPVLLDHADTDRARVALYAAGRAIRSTPPSRLPALLGGILLAPGKVTSRKEAARLLAAYGPPEAMRTLLDAYRQDGQHRDVRAAIVAAARDRPHTPDSWQILTTASAGTREERMAVLAAAPDRLAARHRPRYAALIVALCRAPDREVVNAAYLRLPSWLRHLDEIGDLVVDRLTDLDATYVPPLVLATMDHPGAAAVETALYRLVDLDARDTDAGGPARDRRARRRVEEIARSVESWADRRRTADRTVALRAARWLAGNAPFFATGSGMLAELVEIRMPDLLELAAPRPVLAQRTADRLAARVARERESLDAAVLVAAAQSLRLRGDLAGGLLALALVRAGESYGWSAVWRDLVRGLRDHPDADVRDEAYAVTMA